MKKYLLSLILLLGFCAQASALNCVWTGGTANWDGSNTASWTSCGGGVPGTADTATFDGTSGGGTVTVGASYTVNISSLVMGAFTGTLDFSANNNTVNIGQSTAASTGVSITGTGTRTLNMGGGTWTIDATSSIWNAATTTNLTFNKNSSTIVRTARAGSRTTDFSGGGLSYNNVTINFASGGSDPTITGNNTFALLTIDGLTTGKGVMQFANGTTQTITTLTVSNTSSTNQILFRSNSAALQATLAVTNNASISWLGFWDIAFTTGTHTATNSFDFGNNGGITITAPSSGGGGGGKIIGG